jgi:hypothetical protein
MTAIARSPSTGRIFFSWLVPGGGIALGLGHSSIDRRASDENLIFYERSVMSFARAPRVEVR